VQERYAAGNIQRGLEAFCFWGHPFNYGQSGFQSREFDGALNPNPVLKPNQLLGDLAIMRPRRSALLQVGRCFLSNLSRLVADARSRFKAKR
jgi:hypothetical protein